MTGSTRVEAKAAVSRGDCTEHERAGDSGSPTRRDRTSNEVSRKGKGKKTETKKGHGAYVSGAWRAGRISKSLTSDRMAYGTEVKKNAIASIFFVFLGDVWRYK